MALGAALQLADPSITGHDLSPEGHTGTSGEGTRGPAWGEFSSCTLLHFLLFLIMQMYYQLKNN